MTPAFASPKQAGGFSLLALLLLLAPVLLGKSMLPSRRESYQSASWGPGAFPYLEQEIFEEKRAIDIAIMGSSYIGSAIDPSYLQAKLSAALGREAVVRTFWWGNNGYDPLYFIARDLLRERKVRLILTCDLTEGTSNRAHHAARFWFRFSEGSPELAGLPMRSKVSFYTNSIVGAPRELLSTLRPNRAALPIQILSWPNFPNVPTPAASLGALRYRNGYLPDDPFVRFTPKPVASASDVSVYSAESRADFSFASTNLWPMQAALLKRFVGLARDRAVPLIHLTVPEYEQRRDQTIAERVFWPDFYSDEKFALVGISPAKLYAGLSDADVRKMYVDYVHMNENGQDFFTPTITPKLIQLYESLVGP